MAQSVASGEQQAAALLRLFEAPHYFRRAGKGLFRKAPQETVQAALLAIERKAALGGKARSIPVPGSGVDGRADLYAAAADFHTHTSTRSGPARSAASYA